MASWSNILTIIQWAFYIYTFTDQSLQKKLMFNVILYYTIVHRHWFTHAHLIIKGKKKENFLF
jgi:hypothetical protein